MKLLSQYDAKWGDKTIGDTNITLSRYGCTITCLSMASDYFGCYKAPDELAKKLKFTKDGLILWQSIDDVLCFEFEFRFYGLEESRIDNALNDPSKIVLLEVNHSHWVLARKKMDAGVYKVADPLGGLETFTTKYGRITGGAIMSGTIKNAVQAPSDWAKEAWDHYQKTNVITSIDPQAIASKEWVATVVHRATLK